MNKDYEDEDYEDEEDYLNPSDPINWTLNMTYEECVAGLKRAEEAPFIETQRLSFWLGMSLGTVASLYWKGEKEQAASVIEAACIATQKVSEEQIKDFPEIVETLFRINLCRPILKIDVTRVSSLLKLLPPQPSSTMMDSYVNYQCLFGITNVLEEWNSKFEQYKRDYNWHSYNKEQINFGRKYVNGQLNNKKDMIFNVNDYADFINEEVEDPLLSDFIPWLHWYCEQNFD